MTRLLVLIVEVEQPEGLSSRKLILESMKHNVVTAYSGTEALDLLTRVRPDLIMVHSNLRAPTCVDLLAAVKQSYPTLPTLVISPAGNRCSIEDYVVKSLEPAQLVAFFTKFSEDVLGTQPYDHSSTRTVGAEQESLPVSE